jgi:hypothetical protein
MLTDVFSAVVAHSALSGVTCELGAEFVDENANPPRLVWRPTSDSFQPGQRVNVPGASAALSARQQRCIGIRHAGVRIRVWAEGSGTTKTALGDINATEELVRKLLVAIHETCVGNYEVKGLDWVGADGAELIQQGRACDVSVSFAIPIFKDADATALLTVINAAGMQGAVAFPAGDVTATPSP